MHVQIDAGFRRGLRIIEEIPNIPLCKIEGYNGIGKTSAIRLLQLCTGEQPFKDNRTAWRTFRAQLARANVRISELREAREIEWELTPSEWPEQPELLDDHSVGIIRINGQKASLLEVRQLLKVHHLNTSETPAKILITRTASAASVIDNWDSACGSLRGTEADNALRSVLREL